MSRSATSNPVRRSWFSGPLLWLAALAAGGLVGTGIFAIQNRLAPRGARPVARTAGARARRHGLDSRRRVFDGLRRSDDFASTAGTSR